MLCRTWQRLTVNKSSGHRWSPIPRPPPSGYDRLCGTHAVLHTLKEFALSLNGAAAAAAAGSSEPAAAAPASHPHRSGITCLYVRDFSIEQEDGPSAPAEGQQHVQKKRKVIPKQYANLHRITAVAKLLAVPIRYVPRKELVQLCGDRRNQNVVLEVGQFKPKKISSAIELTGVQAWLQQQQQQQQGLLSTTNNNYTVLFLDNIVDPTNVGTIIRTGYFYGVDEVVLSHDASHCTAAVARSSAGLLEHMGVYQCFPSVRTTDFLQHTRADWAALQSSMTEPTSSSSGSGSGSQQGAEGLRMPQLQLIASTAEPRAAAQADATAAAALPPPPSPPVPTLRILLLGNEDKGLSALSTQACTHTAHIVSPRQQRLRASQQPHLHHHAAAADGAAREEGQRAYQQRRLLQLSPSDVSLNVNTACASLLPQLLGDAAPLIVRPILPSAEKGPE